MERLFKKAVLKQLPDLKHETNAYLNLMLASLKLFVPNDELNKVAPVRPRCDESA